MAKNIKAQYTYRAGATTPDEIVDRISAGIEEAGSFPAFVNALIVQNEKLRDGEEMPLTPITQAASGGSSYDDTRIMAEISAIREDIQGMGDGAEISPVLLDALKKIMGAVGAIHNEGIAHYEDICARLDVLAENGVATTSQPVPAIAAEDDEELPDIDDSTLDDDSLLGLDTIINDSPIAVADDVEHITDDVDSPFYEPIIVPEFDLDQPALRDVPLTSVPVRTSALLDDDDDVVLDDDNDVLDGLASLLG